MPRDVKWPNFNDDDDDDDDGAGGGVTTTGDTTYDNGDLDDAIFRSFLRFFRSFVRFFVRSKIFQKIGRAAAMILVQKSSSYPRDFSAVEKNTDFLFIFS